MFSKMSNFLWVIAMCFIVCSASVITKEKSSKRVCVIGAGLAGLSAARYLKAEGIEFTVLEATQYVGGTWRYDPRIGTDENGVPIRTSMYRHLRTNLPKPTMELPGFPIPDDIPSFPSGETFHKYIQNFTKHFDLEKHIHFLHNVVLVRKEGNIWRVKHQHVKTRKIFEEEYDYVVVGNGHFSKPNMPTVKGSDIFKGTIIHSHDYRVPDPYKDRVVLIVGAGPSGLDIAKDVASVAKVLVHSHHSRANFKTVWPSNYIRKPDVRELTENGAVFVDGTYEDLDDIIYCTGFNYDFPFLDETSELTIKPHSIVPLYRHMVNINQPTMLIMGLVSKACLVISLDAQARYITALIKGNFSLPSREVMMEDWQKRVDALKSQGLPLFFLNVVEENENQYYEELTGDSGIEIVPPVLYKIRAVDTQGKIDNLFTYRNYKYTVIDDETFTRELEDPTAHSSLAP